MTASGHLTEEISSTEIVGGIWARMNYWPTQI